MEPAKAGFPMLADLQAQPLAVSEDAGRGKGILQQRDRLVQGNVGGAQEQVADDLLFDPELLLVVAVLQVAAAADAVMRAGRCYPVGGGLNDGGGDGLRESLFFEDNMGADGFAKQDMADEDDLAIFPAGQTVAAIDYFFNPEKGDAHFFHDVRVEEVVFYLQK
jgi:hypothetical protein